MLNVTRILCGTENSGDALRYSKAPHRSRSGAAEGLGPVVAWNMTRACNLACLHCYASAASRPAAGELTTAEAKELLADLAAFKVPALLLSGGEPLLRPDFFELAEFAASLGLRVTLSTNGTLITPEVARRIREAGIVYVGVSLDGDEKTHDTFRGRPGAYRAALEGIRNCLAADQKVGLRFTLCRQNLPEVEAVFKLAAREGIGRICFYHLAYAGRGTGLAARDITNGERRRVVGLIAGLTAGLCRREKPAEVLTVNNHADAAYLFLRLAESDRERAKEAYRLLRRNGGNRSGAAIGAVDWNGNVHPDQFTWNKTVGNVREQPFSEIWKNNFHPLLGALRNRRGLLKGRCASCRFLDICNGNSRARAEAVYGDYWAPDPACYLTDEEIAGGGWGAEAGAAAAGFFRPGESRG
jgi:radical SAM protein with 4Fe4S-binding SPASM domain